MSKVLVIDDSPLIYKMVKRALEPHGHLVVGYAENGKIGLYMYKDLNPDIVTLDVTMPVMDGLETASNLYKIDPNAKIIMLSAMGDDELINSAQNIGIKYFHQKPIKYDKLHNQVNEILEE